MCCGWWGGSEEEELWAYFGIMYADVMPEIIDL
jgi:hypothetical protein